MNYNFTKENIECISKLLSVEPEVTDNHYTWSVKSANYMTDFSVSLFTNIPPNDTNLISIQTALGYYELHNIKCWNEFNDSEIVFFADNSSLLSVVFISKEHGISFYSSIEQSILEKDIAEIDPSLMLSYMQCSMYSNYKSVFP